MQLGQTASQGVGDPMIWRMKAPAAANARRPASSRGKNRCQPYSMSGPIAAASVTLRIRSISAGCLGPAKRDRRPAKGILFRPRPASPTLSCAAGVRIVSKTHEPASAGAAGSAHHARPLRHGGNLLPSPAALHLHPPTVGTWPVFALDRRARPFHFLTRREYIGLLAVLSG